MAPENLTIGDSVTMDDVTFTVHGARWAESEFVPPASGRGYLAIDISVANGKDDAYIVSSGLAFKLVNSEGRSQEETFNVPPEGTLGGTLAAGRTMRGEVIYDVNESDTSWELIIAPELFETDQAFFTIPAPERKAS
jgi:hypothetical protein